MQIYVHFRKTQIKKYKICRYIKNRQNMSIYQEHTKYVDISRTDKISFFLKLYMIKITKTYFITVIKIVTLKSTILVISKSLIFM